MQEKREIHPQDQEETDAPGKANSKEGLIPKKETRGSQSQTAGVIAIEVADVEVIGGIE